MAKTKSKKRKLLLLAAVFFLATSTVNGKTLVNTNAKEEGPKVYFENGFSAETNNIVKAHMNDFDYESFDSFMTVRGGTEEYVRSLGGVFTKWVGKQGNVQTAEEFTEVAEYILGIMMIWGPDYSGGSGDIKFNALNGEEGRFYAGQNTGRHWKQLPLEEVYFHNKERIVTDCGCGTYYILQKAGLCDTYAGEDNKEDALRRVDTENGGKVIEKVKDLQVGDLIQMSHTSDEFNWGHVCIVAEVHDDGTVSTYDTGSLFAENARCRFLFKENPDGTLGGDYSEYKDWFGMRFRQLHN